jgi:hypothetical protein
MKKEKKMVEARFIALYVWSKFYYMVVCTITDHIQDHVAG